MSKSTAVSLAEAFSKVKLLEGRTPKTTNEQAKDAFALLSEYRDGGIYIAHYAASVNGKDIQKEMSLCK